MQINSAAPIQTLAGGGSVQGIVTPNKMNSSFGQPSPGKDQKGKSAIKPKQFVGQFQSASGRHSPLAGNRFRAQSGAGSINTNRSTASYQLKTSEYRASIESQKKEQQTPKEENDYKPLFFGEDLRRHSREMLIYSQKNQRKRDLDIDHDILAEMEKTLNLEQSSINLERFKSTQFRQGVKEQVQYQNLLQQRKQSVQSNYPGVVGHIQGATPDELNKVQNFQGMLSSVKFLNGIGLGSSKGSQAGILSDSELGDYDNKPALSQTGVNLNNSEIISPAKGRAASALSTTIHSPLNLTLRKPSNVLQYPLQKASRIQDIRKEKQSILTKIHQQMKKEAVKQQIKAEISQKKEFNQRPFDIQQWRINHNQFKDNLFVFSDLKMELELAFDIVEKLNLQNASESTVEQISPEQQHVILKGIIANLQHSISQYQEAESGFTLNEKDAIFDRFKEMSLMYRNILRILAQDQDKNKIVVFVLDLLWKNIVMLCEGLFGDVDTFITNKVNYYREDFQDKKILVERYNTNLKNQFEEYKKQSIKRIKELETSVENLERDCVRLNELVRNRDDELRYIEDPNAFRDLRIIIKEIDSKFGEQELEKEIQVTKMNSLLGIMSELEKQNEIDKSSMKQVKKKRKARFGHGHGTNPVQTEQIREVEKQVVIIKKVGDSKRRQMMISGVTNGQSLDMIDDLEFLKSNTPFIKKLVQMAQERHQNYKDEHIVSALNQIITMQRHYAKQVYQQKNQIQELLEKYEGLVIKEDTPKTAEEEKQLDEEDNLQEAQDLMLGIIKSEVETQTPYEFVEGIGIGSEQFENHQREKVFRVKNKRLIKRSIVHKEILKVKNTKGYDKLPILPEGQSYKLIEGIFEEKFKQEQENPSGVLMNSGQHVGFFKFVMEYFMMKFGLKQIALKNLIQLKNVSQEILIIQSLLSIQDDAIAAPYPDLMRQVMGFKPPFLSIKEIRVIVNSRIIFLEAQNQWKQNSAKQKNSKISDESFHNFRSGGLCLVFELIEVVTRTIDKDSDLKERLLPQILPSIPKEVKYDVQARQRFFLDFSFLKICSKMAKMGRDIKFIYDTLDRDGSGELERDELMDGLKKYFNLYFSNEEVDEMMQCLDEDESGDIDYEEFSEKVNYKEYNEKLHKFTINKAEFIQLMLVQWKNEKERQYKKLKEEFHKERKNKHQLIDLSEQVFQTFTITSFITTVTLVISLTILVKMEVFSFKKYLHKLEPLAFDDKKFKRLLDDVSVTSIIVKQYLEVNDELEIDDGINEQIFSDVIFENRFGDYGREFFADPQHRKTSIGSPKQTMDSNN